MSYDKRTEGGGRSGGAYQGRHGKDRPRRTLDASMVRFRDQGGKTNPELFNKMAQGAAQIVAECRKEMNKSTQLRRFYDEVVMWDEKASQHPEKFEEYLPFIRMLNAKAAYAEGRKLVDGAFGDLVSHCVAQVERAEDMRIFKLFFEAFMGFYKLEKG